MQRIDAHQHFWQYDPVRDSWITDDMQVLRKNYLPAELKPLLDMHHIGESIVVQSSQTEEENDFQLALSEQYAFIKAVVGWVDLRSNHIHDRLAYYRSFKKLKGFRHMLESEQDRALMLTPAFKNGIAALREYGYTYDLLIREDQFDYAIALAAAFPDQKFVLDHLGKPAIKKGSIKDWINKINDIAQHKNVYCKISGMITEADWNSWTAADLHPYIDTVVNAFGTKRIIYGSDWPVCLLAGTYQDVIRATDEYFASFSAEEQADFYGGNAARFYNLNETI